MNTGIILSYIKYAKLILPFLNLKLTVFQCVAMLTIVDNIVDSLTTGLSKLHDRKHYCRFVTTFFLMPWTSYDHQGNLNFFEKRISVLYYFFNFDH